MKVFQSSILLSVSVCLISVYGFTEELKTNVRKNFGENMKFISIPVEHMTKELHMHLEENHLVDQFGHMDGDFHYRMSDSAIKVLEEVGAKFEDKTETFLEETERFLHEPSNVCLEDTTTCASREFDDFYSTYQKYDAIHARFEKMAAEHPSITSLQTLGLSHEGREQKLFLIGDQSKPLVFYGCTIHAREWITPMFCTYMAETLLTSTDPSVQRLLDVFSFAIVPIGNPDGYVYTFESDNFWRKTRKPTNRARCVGTDPNRNYQAGWGGQGSSGNECSDTFRGYSPFDQPCTFNIKTFTDANQDRLIHVNDVHSYGAYWMCAYSSYNYLPKQEDWVRMDTCNKRVQAAIRQESGTNFKVGASSQTLYTAAGASVDYFYEVNGVVHSYIYEARPSGGFGLNGFQPAATNIMPSNIELFAGMAAALECIEEIELSPIARGSPLEPTSSEPSTGMAVAGIMFIAVAAVLIVVGVFKMNRDRKAAALASGTEIGATL